MPVKHTDRTREVGTKISAQAALATLLGTELLATIISRGAPVVTGFLKAQVEPVGTVNLDRNRYKGTVQDNAEYAAAVEFGLPDQPNRRVTPFFRRGGEKAKRPIEALIKKTLPKSNADI